MKFTPTSPVLSGVLNALRGDPGLAVFDAGERWTVVTWGDGPVVSGPHRWRRRARELLTGSTPAPHLPYAGGLVGWLGYEAGGSVERMPTPQGPRHAPDLLLWRTEGGLCLDRQTGQWHIGGSAAFSQRAQEALAAASSPLLPQAAGGPAAEPAEAASTYTDGVREILAAIRAGDVYQVCLAWEQVIAAMPDPLASWLLLRQRNPALRGAYLRHGPTTVLSNSPELFLQIDRSGDTLTAESVPIKGTCRHAQGSAGRLALWESDKERAELTMIVDLVRNDLGRVSRPGSVHAAPRTLRRCGDLLHAEQHVRGILEPGLDAFDAVAASFPPGSVTGAPKVAAMSIINRLEATPRGIYTGSLGYFTDDGRAHLNVAIRTATVTEGRCSYHIGAGIVADSDPDREWHETLAKGTALGAWLGAR